MKTIVIGVMSQDQIRARVIAIAKGEYKPRPDEPKIWFTSMKSAAEALNVVFDDDYDSMAQPQVEVSYYE